MTEHKIPSVLAGLIRGAADILFPRCCSACGKKLMGELETSMCSDCSSEISFLQHPLCRICGTELAGDKERNYLCGGCLRFHPPFSLARSMVRYSRPVKKLLHRLKYSGDTSGMPGITELAGRFDMTPFDQCDCIIPVPLHVKRLRHRGLNQSVLLAKNIFPREAQAIMHTDFLIRRKNTAPQTTLDGVKRRKNLRGAFTVSEKARIKQKTICLVDDVYTTGTTVSECSRVLCLKGAGEVRVLTFTRVQLS